MPVFEERFQVGAPAETVWALLNDPVRHGPDVAETLRSSRRAGLAIDQAAALALELHGPDAPLARLAETAFRELAFELPLLFDRRTIVPPATAATIRAHLVARGWNPDQR